MGLHAITLPANPFIIQHRFPQAMARTRFICPGASWHPDGMHPRTRMGFALASDCRSF
jgi:hypothetical protein